MPRAFGENAPEHRLLPLRGQMHAQAASNESKHSPCSVIHGHGREGSLVCAKPGTHVPRSCVGNEPLVPLAPPALEPAEPPLLGAGSPPSVF